MKHCEYGNEGNSLNNVRKKALQNNLSSTLVIHRNNFNLIKRQNNLYESP